MPGKVKSDKPVDVLAPVPDEVLNQFAREGVLDAAEVEAATRRFKKALIERVLGAELSHHLGYRSAEPRPPETTNHRNGSSSKTVLTDDGPLPIAVPPDRAGAFEPQLIGKDKRRFTGFDDKILALHARGLTVRGIQAFLAEAYTIDVSPDFIGSVTAAGADQPTAKAAKIKSASHNRIPDTPVFPSVRGSVGAVEIAPQAVQSLG